MQEKVNEMFYKIFDKYYVENEEESTHKTINGVVIYWNKNKRDENFCTVKYAGIDLNKNGTLNFDNYYLFENRKFYLETFIDFITDKLINGVEDACQAEYFFSYEKKPNSNNDEIIEVENPLNIENKTKAEMLDKILNRKLIIE